MEDERKRGLRPAREGKTREESQTQPRAGPRWAALLHPSPRGPGRGTPRGCGGAPTLFLSFELLDSNTCLALPLRPTPALGKISGWLFFLGGGRRGEVSRIPAVPPVRPQKRDSTPTGSRSSLGRPRPAGAPPLPTSAPRAGPAPVSPSARPSRLGPPPAPRAPAPRFHPPVPTSQPRLSSSSPLLGSPPRQPHPWEAPPVGQRRLYKRFLCPGAAAAGRWQLCWCGGGEDPATAAGARPPPPAPPFRPPSGRPQPCGSPRQAHLRPTPRASAASSRDPAC